MEKIQGSLHWSHKRQTYDMSTLVQKVAGHQFVVDPDLQHHIAQLVHNELTHWGRDTMAFNFQTTISNAFSWMKISNFRLKFHYKLFQVAQLATFQHWYRQRSNYVNQWSLVYWRIYASLGDRMIKKAILGGEIFFAPCLQLCYNFLDITHDD